MVKAINKRIVIRPILETKSNGVVIPPSDKQKERAEKGEVVYSDSELVKVGNVVLFSRYDYQEFNIDGENLLIIKEENIPLILS